ncbi:hypothetical protein [Bryobacter aggregatus]|uniref:hypothetical protein n=1 Tax=Bryobacter aggregatus TaxID=360054 RepID=UPI0004E241A6|nr:hypothetical protein [Bryobacter aggregatus]
MARGWESKDIESQQELREERAAAAKKVQKTAEEVAREHALEDLELNRRRVLRDLRQTNNQRYRLQLEESLRFLEAEIAKVSGSGSPPAAAQPPE